MKIYLFLILFLFGSLAADCNGRIDIGPVFLRIDNLENEKTVRTLYLGGLRADATIMIYSGLCVKPSYLYATGKSDLQGGSVGLGYCLPLPCKIVITPSFGLTETRFKGYTDIPEYGLTHLKERFISRGYYIGCDVSWTFIDHWRLYAIGQYGWSRVHTKVGPFKFHNNAEGPNFALALERDLSEQFSATLSAGYNSSLDDDKFGIRGAGLKLGFCYWW